MSSYTPTIGLEIHAELKTRTKMFCNSANDPHSGEPNTHICPVCMGFPGTLPVINKEAVRHVLRVGVAINGTVADFTEFDRKNYFYPDLPKGYQISQYKYPLISGGTLSDVAITRIHLEEDTARSQHPSTSLRTGTGGEYTLIDFNRAGVPLMELVTEPVIHDAATAIKFAEELQLLLRTLGASDANMERGEMRVEANISVSKNETFGTKVEVKNLNSFKSVGGAIEFEIARHIELLERGEKVVQETRGWDENKGSTFSQRLKEDSHDYRYFPDPDLPKLHLSKIPEFSIDTLRASLPELPNDRRRRYRAYGIKEEDTETLVHSDVYRDFFDTQVLAKTDDTKIIVLAANYLLSDVRGSGAGKDELSRLGEFISLMQMVSSGELNSRGAKDTLAHMLTSGGSPREIAEKEGLMQINDEGAIQKVALEVLSENPDAVAEIKAGKGSALQFLVGQGMKKSKGTLNPGELLKVFEKELGL